MQFWSFAPKQVVVSDDLRASPACNLHPKTNKFWAKDEARCKVGEDELDWVTCCPMDKAELPLMSREKTCWLASTKFRKGGVCNIQPRAVLRSVPVEDPSDEVQQRLQTCVGVSAEVQYRPVVLGPARKLKGLQR